MRTDKNSSLYLNEAKNIWYNSGISGGRGIINFINYIYENYLYSHIYIINYSTEYLYVNNYTIENFKSIYIVDIFNLHKMGEANKL